MLLSVNIYGQYYVRTLGLRSSLEGSNRKFACPQESIALTCNISGLVLIWEAQEGNNTSDSVRVGFFSQNDHAGEGFSNLKQFSCHRELIFSGVLEYINSSIYISHMITTPSSWNVSSNCDPLTIICKSSDPGAEANTMNMTYKVAGELIMYIHILLCISFSYYTGRPTAPRNSTCIYHEYSDLNIVVNVMDIMLNNIEETDISYVSIAVSINTRDPEPLQNYSISSITKIDTLNVTFNYHNHSVDDQIRAYIIAVDKCGQESLSEVINCSMTLGSKGTVTIWLKIFAGQKFCQ